MKGGYRLAAVTLTAVAALSGCGSGGSPPSASAPPVEAPAPYVVMGDDPAWELVWPSGDEWVLLSSTDGFRTVHNRTPVGVDTSGGLALATGRGRAVVAVGPYDRLVTSPVLVAGARWRWQPQELPGAVTATPDSVAVTGSDEYAVLAGHRGTVVARSGSGWRRLVSAEQVAPGTSLHLDAITSLGSAVVVSGYGARGVAKAYRSPDGVHWSPVPGSSAGVAALRACPSPAGERVPVLDGSGTLRVVAPGGVSGAAVPVDTRDVVFGCVGSTMLVADRRGHVLSSSDGGRRWVDRGAGPAHLASLAPTADGNGYATSAGDSPALWRVSKSGARFTRLVLPRWVATLGAQSGSD